MCELITGNCGWRGGDSGSCVTGELTTAAEAVLQRGCPVPTAPAGTSAVNCKSAGFRFINESSGPAFDLEEGRTINHGLETCKAAVISLAQSLNADLNVAVVESAAAPHGCCAVQSLRDGASLSHDGPEDVRCFYNPRGNKAATTVNTAAGSHQIEHFCLRSTHCRADPKVWCEEDCVTRFRPDWAKPALGGQQKHENGGNRPRR